MTLFSYVSALLHFFLSQQAGTGARTTNSGTAQPVATSGGQGAPASGSGSAPTTPASTPTVAATEAASSAAASGASAAAPQSQAVEQAKAAQGTDQTQLGLILKAILTGSATEGAAADAPDDATANPLAELAQLPLDESAARAMAEAQLQSTRDAVILQRVSDVATAYSEGATLPGSASAADGSALLARFEAAAGPNAYAGLLQAMATATAPAGSGLSLRL
ncbi:MAG: hypothetical protein AB7U46_14665 [Paenirhodobacter sp.]|uniref:hypothetical protein n=1 Tax=Paenirhodobacter sp. TaxID=1965326 RepID=UPI003D0EC871